jgi:hypothetical protein
MISRVRGLSRIAVAASSLAVLCSVSAAARDKAQPAPDWAVEAAKTPTPASAKDAPAVVLFDEYLITVDNQNRAVERERRAVRILKPQGRRHAQCYAAYDIDEKLNYFRSWTFTPENRQFQAMEADFTDFGASDSSILQMTERVRTVRPPASDPGAVVVCEIETQLRPYMSEELWDIQDSIPIVDQALELVLPPGEHFSSSFHATPTLKPAELSNGHLRWEIKDMPALDLENVHATPDRAALEARVSIQWGDSAAKGVENQWHAIGLWQEGLQLHRTDSTPEIAAKALELTSGATDFYTKLSRITDYIQKNIRYFVVERGIGGWQPHAAADIFRNRYGDCKDKATLLIAMLQSVGIPAHSLSVDHRRGFVDPEAPSRFGDHMIAAIELPSGDSDPRLMARVKMPDGKTLLIFDPTDQETPVGLIREELQGGWGYLADGDSSRILQMPVLSSESAGEVRKGVFTLTPDGAIAGDIHETFAGDDAMYERWFLKDNDTKEIREKLEQRISSELPGLTMKGFEFHDVPDLDKPLNLDLHLAVTSYARTSGPLLLLRPRVLGSHARVVPEIMEGKIRIYPIELGHPGHWRDSFDIAIPSGYVVDETPNSVNIDLDFASYHSSASAKGNLLHYECEYVVRQVEIPPTKAADFRQLENAILSDEKGAAVLKKQ